jgi:hypothetical protein
VSSLPSFIFLGFPSTADRRFVGWKSFRESIAAGRRLDDVGSTAAIDAGVIEFPRVGIWRLVASNHRELGRSWAAYPSFRAARDHVVRLQSAVDEIEVSPIKGVSPSQNGWVASLHGEPVLSSGRWFGASSTSLHSAVTTLAAFETAVIADAAWSSGRDTERPGAGSGSSG